MKTFDDRFEARAAVECFDHVLIRDKGTGEIILNRRDTVPNKGDDEGRTDI